jgi:hypothetical protein
MTCMGLVHNYAGLMTCVRIRPSALHLERTYTNTSIALVARCRRSRSVPHFITLSPYPF